MTVLIDNPVLSLSPRPHQEAAIAAVEHLVRRVTHCRLETHPEFFNYFVEGCQFNPVESLAKTAS